MDVRPAVDAQRQAGAGHRRRADIPAKDAGRIVDAVSFLRSVASGERPVSGRRVAVYGAGNTAMDAARVARRLGADIGVMMKAGRDPEGDDEPNSTAKRREPAPGEK